MAEVEIGLAAVVGHVDLAVLIRAHRARIDVDVRVELLQRHLVAVAFEQRADRGGGETLAERRHDAAHAGPALAALDLAESLDVRERRAGGEALTRALERFRD